MNTRTLIRIGWLSSGLVIFFTIIAMSLGFPAMACGMALACCWQAASVLLLVWVGRLLMPPVTKRQAWGIAGIACLKFPVLYGLGFLALKALAPSPIGLLLGLTIPWGVLVIYAGLQLLRQIAAPAIAGQR